MAVLKKIFSSLRKLFGQKLPGGKKRRPQRKAKRKVSRKALPRVRRESSGRSRATRPAKKKIQKKQGKTQPPGQPAQAGQPVGEITHFFSKIKVAVVKMTKGNLAVGDKVHIYGKSTDFTQTVRSMQIESVDVRSARRGQLIGLKVDRAAKVGDKLIRLR